jgi:predicted AAA+ superfamily ATPase
MPAVFLNGPRQAGKSTLAQHIARTYMDADYVTFDDISTLAAASNDPEGFLRQFQKPVIIDEVQMVPEVFRVLKLIIDERRAQDKGHANGRFLLTGSTNILALPGLADALVGRMAVLSLYPLAAVESLGNGQPGINGWFDQDINFNKADAQKPKDPSFNDIIREATFPEISSGPAANNVLWFESYLTTLLQRDVRQLAEIEKIPALPNMIKILAARAGSLLNDAACARDAKLNAVTYRHYRVLLQQLFLISLVPPWYRNIGKRFVKSPKLFFVDTALLCHALGVDAANLQKQNPGLFGHVLENFVASELTKQLAMLADGGTLYHFRTHDDKEVDFMIERRSGELLGFEVKGRDSITPDDFAGLKALKEQAGTDFRRGIVLYLGKTTISFGDDFWAMPIQSLWKFNMTVTADKELQYSFELGSYVFWANYGDSTRIRCEIPQATIDDHFHDNASESQSLVAIKKHWDLIWSIFEQKIVDGQITTIIQAPGAQVAAARRQKLFAVRLQSGDLGRRDFRRR